MTLEELKAIIEAATEGPWEVSGHGKVETPSLKNVRGENHMVCLVYPKDDTEHQYYYQCEQDTTKLIAASRTALPNALALLDEMVAELRDIRDNYDCYEADLALTRYEAFKADVTAKEGG